MFFQGDLAASLTSLRELAKVGAGYIIRTCKITQEFNILLCWTSEAAIVIPLMLPTSRPRILVVIKQRGCQ